MMRRVEEEANYYCRIDLGVGGEANRFRKKKKGRKSEEVNPSLQSCPPLGVIVSS